MPTHWESRSEPIPGYRLVERLGRGGFGEVWKAEAPGGLSKAIKFVHGELTGGDGYHAQQELKALERVRECRHPFILSMERFDIIDGQLIIVMEIADCSLEQRLREHQRQGLAGIPRAELLGYMTEAAQALDFMSNDFDLQHLDIKPQNIFLIGGHVKVADFGLVKDLEGCTASVTGGVTPVYAPPETFDGWVSRNSDQYSLAVVYEELLTGKRPFTGPSARQYMMQHLTADPDLSPLPASDRAIVRRALAKDPKDRFPSCREFVDHLCESSKSSYSTTSLDTFATDTVRAHGDGGTSTRLGEPSPLEEKTTVRSKPVLDRAALKAATGGNLRPTLIIGLGETGLATAGRLQGKLRAKYGSRSRWPIVRTLGIDVESAAARFGNAELPADLVDHLLLCKFRKPNQYFQAWEELKHLRRWLDPNVMFQISSVGGTNGHRALGRLAIFENHRRIVASVRTEIEWLLDPVRVQEAMAATGERLRTDEPKVCLVASMGGGVGSGMFIDLCYLVRMVLLESGMSSPDVEGYLLASHRSEKNAVGEQRRINSFALAQDILDYSQAEASYSVDYDGHGESHSFTGPPCKAIYYFDAENPALPDPKVEAVEDAIADALIHHTTTPLGKQIEGIERQERWPAHRNLGIFTLTYPMRDLLSATAKRFCAEVVAQWLEPMPRRDGDTVMEQAVAVMTSAGFDAGDIGESLLDACNAHLPEPIHVLAGKLLVEIEDRLKSAKRKDHDDIFKDGMLAVKELLGVDPDEENLVLKEEPVYEAALNRATNDLAAELLEPLREALHSQLDRPGHRLERWRRTWEGFSSFLLQKLDQTQESIRTEIQRVCRRSRQLRERITGVPESGSGTISGPTGRRMAMLNQYVEEKIACRVREQVFQVYLVLRGKLSDWSRDLVRVRQNVDQLLQRLEEPTHAPAVHAQGWASQTLFPGGYISLDEACEHLYEQVHPVAQQDLDAWLQSSTIIGAGGLWAVCSKDEEFQKGLPGMILGSAMRWLQEGLSDIDVAQAFWDRHTTAEDAGRELSSFYEWSSPSSPYRSPRGAMDAAPPTERWFIMTPPTAGGQAIVDMFRAQGSAAAPTVITEGEECVFYRTQAHAALARILPKWVLESKALYDAAKQSRLSPEIFPQLAEAVASR